MRIYAVDPGETTGWALWTDDLEDVIVGPGGRIYSVGEGVVLGRGRWWAGQVGEEGELGAAETLVCGMLSYDIVVVEDFVLRPTGSRGDKGRKGLSPVRVTCYLQALLYAEETNVRWVLQQPSAAKGVITDTRLRNLGLWVKGKPHARDALRHLALYLRSANIPIG